MPRTKSEEETRKRKCLSPGNRQVEIIRQTLRSNPRERRRTRAFSGRLFKVSEASKTPRETTHAAAAGIGSPVNVVAFSPVAAKRL